MNTVTYYNTRDTPKRTLLPNKNDIFNENPDASLPKHPPSTKSQSLLRIRDSGGEGQRVNAIFRIQTHQKSQKKKKEVIFSEDLEERCSISPKKMEPEEIRLNLAKTAKKGILRRREGAASCNNIPERTKTPIKQQEQKIMSMALDTSILLEYDNAQKESQNKKLMNLKAVQNEPSQKTAINAKSWRTATEPEDLNDSSLSIEENSVMQEQKSSKTKSASPRSLEKQIENVKEILKPLTGLHEPIQKWASVSDVIAAATEKIESTRQNQSSIAGSLNDLPLISTPREALNGGSKTASFNEINAKAENVKKPLRVSQSMNNLDVAGDKGSNDSKGLLKLPTISKGHASPNPSPAFLSDMKAAHQPLIKGYQSLTRHISSQSMKGIENFNPNGSHTLMKPSFTANFDTGKLQTQSTTNLLGMKVLAPLSQLKAKPMFNLPDINADSNSITTKEDNNNFKKEGLMTFCIKDTNQGVWYNVKEGIYKCLGQEYGLGLEGTAYCKMNDESIVVTGGADHQQNKVVSSKATFANVRKGEKEVLPGMPIARYNHAVYVSGKSLYAIGGQSFDEKILKSCYMFEVGSRNWFRIPSMQYERANPLVCGSSKDGNLYVIGGTNSEGKEVGWIEKFDQQKQVWQPVYNTAKAKLNTREAIVIGNISTSQGEEVLILVKDSRVDGGNFKYTLFAFDLENEILNKYESFQYESKGIGVQGFVNGNKLYLTEKGKWNIMDEYCLEKRIWKQRTFTKTN